MQFYKTFWSSMPARLGRIVLGTACISMLERSGSVPRTCTLECQSQRDRCVHRLAPFTTCSRRFCRSSWAVTARRLLLHRRVHPCDTGSLSLLAAKQVRNIAQGVTETAPCLSEACRWGGMRRFSRWHYVKTSQLCTTIFCAREDGWKRALFNCMNFWNEQFLHKNGGCIDFLLRTACQVIFMSLDACVDFDMGRTVANPA